ncbi:MAG: hypothetical protein H6912_09655 [Kordiimonadaceae bacterium]|nr:hypothetical protein [Kordiimonadaceae bacterium]
MLKKITFVLFLLISACATPSQDARIEIFPKVNPSDIGRGTTLAITVDDARSTGVIGTMGKESQIVTSQDLAELIGLSLVDSFSKQGFTVSSASDPSAVNMMVSLEDLSYSKDGNLVTTDVETKSRIKVDVSSKGFIRTYSNSEERTVPFSSNEDSNNSQLRSILENLVEKIVNDQELIGALRR